MHVNDLGSRKEDSCLKGYVHNDWGHYVKRHCLCSVCAQSHKGFLGYKICHIRNRSPEAKVPSACLCRKSNLLTLWTFALQRAEELSDEGVFLRASALLANGQSV